MERLTFEGNFCDIALCSEVRGGSFCEDGACSQRKVWERLKAYEDAEEQGRLVRLPCKVGDTVYMVAKVGTCHWEEDKCIRDDPGQWKIYEKKFSLLLVNEICGHYESGQSIFVTREEAEAALKARADHEG